MNIIEYIYIYCCWSKSDTCLCTIDFGRGHILLLFLLYLFGRRASVARPHESYAIVFVLTAYALGYGAVTSAMPVMTRTRDSSFHSIFLSEATGSRPFLCNSGCQWMSRLSRPLSSTHGLRGELHQREVCALASCRRSRSPPKSTVEGRDRVGRKHARMVWFG